MTMLEMSSLLLGNKTRCSNPSIIHLNYNILPTKTTSSSAHDVWGMDGSFSVTTTRKEVGENLSRVHSSFSEYGIHFLDSVIVWLWLLLCDKVAELTLIRHETGGEKETVQDLGTLVACPWETQN